MTGSYELRDLDHASARKQTQDTRTMKRRPATRNPGPRLCYCSPCGEAGSESAVPGTDTGFAYYLAGVTICPAGLSESSGCQFQLRANSLSNSYGERAKLLRNCVERPELGSDESPPGAASGAHLEFLSCSSALSFVQLRRPGHPPLPRPVRLPAPASR